MKEFTCILADLCYPHLGGPMKVTYSCLNCDEGVVYSSKKRFCKDCSTTQFVCSVCRGPNVSTPWSKCQKCRCLGIGKTRTKNKDLV